MSVKHLPNLGNPEEDRKRVFSKSDLLVICDTIVGMDSDEAKSNLDKLILAGKLTPVKEQFVIFPKLNVSAPKRLLSRKLKYNVPLDILDIHPKELARQLTLIEFELFCKIEPSRDLVNVSKAKSATVNDCIQYSNTLSRWVAGEVVKTPNLKKRVAVIRRFIEIAEETWNLKNFSSSSAILYGLDHRAVQRLQLTWKAVPKRDVKRYQELIELISVKDNFKKLRVAKSQVSPPLVPYLAIYLKDISLLELGNPTILEGTTDTLNFTKFSMISERFLEIIMLQKCAYNFRWCSVLARWLEQISFVSEDELFNFSDLCEERLKTVESSITKASSFPSFSIFRK